jgi:(E)-4-hydroxy-3-methylbut-2-enyl-diphosphate synthase
LVADIHFTPNAAMIAAQHVEKVRVNPGNYADKKKFHVLEYSDAQYAEEIERVAERFRPLVLRCKELGRAMRIGTNHGSLSDRVLNRFGDTPAGMVESALEFLDVCEAEGFHDVVFSMKASNTQVAIQAYRLLAARLEARAPGEPSYPFHLGVTEAGDGEDGRIKSAIGIGALLEDGIGETIRVSLTEDPVAEVPVARAIAQRAEACWKAAEASAGKELIFDLPYCRDPYTHERRSTSLVDVAGMTWGGEAPVRVELDLGEVSELSISAEALAADLAGLREVQCEGVIVSAKTSSECSQVEEFAAALKQAGVQMPLSLRWLGDALCEPLWLTGRLLLPCNRDTSPEILQQAFASAHSGALTLQLCLSGDLTEFPALLTRALAQREPGTPLFLSASSSTPVQALRRVAAQLESDRARDVLLVLTHTAKKGRAPEREMLAAATELGSLLCDGLGDGLLLTGFDGAASSVEMGYRILQGARLRTSWTEFISCPSCGRTLFDLEETTARIKSKTDHLKGLKIAIMGCIVNGPGEMADADFGYVGAGVDKINLYVGHEIVERNIPQAEADERLVELIRKEGRWVDPS